MRKKVRICRMLERYWVRMSVEKRARICVWMSERRRAVLLRSTGMWKGDWTVGWLDVDILGFGDEG